MKRKNTIAFDFDNVIHKYRKGWHDGSIYDELDARVLLLMWKLLGLKHPVFIMSTRESQQIHDHFKRVRYDPKVEFVRFKTEVIPDDQKFWKRTDVVGITNRKLPFNVLVDDRAIQFNPALPLPTIEQLVNFEPKKYK